MKRYRAHDTVDEGFYLNPRRLGIKSLEERGPLPGEAGDTYVRIPTLAVLPIGLAVSLIYVVFLPLVGFLMLGRIAVEKLYRLAAGAARSGVRVLRPSWLPARAYLSRGEKSRLREGDDWADEAAGDLGRSLPAAAEIGSPDRGRREAGPAARNGYQALELAHEALALELVDRCISLRRSMAPASEAEDDSPYGADLGGFAGAESVGLWKAARPAARLGRKERSMRPIVARDLMTPDVLTVRDNMSVAELATFLSDNEITGAPVEDADGQVVGVVSVVDIARADSESADRTAWESVGTNSYSQDWNRSLGDGIRTYRLQEDRILVRDIMNTAVHSVGEEAEVSEVASKMLHYHLHRLLVIEDGGLAGIISSSDLIGLLVEDE